MSDTGFPTKEDYGIACVSNQMLWKILRQNPKLKDYDVGKHGGYNENCFGVRFKDIVCIIWTDMDYSDKVKSVSHEISVHILSGVEYYPKFTKKFYNTNGVIAIIEYILEVTAIMDPKNRSKSVSGLPPDRPVLSLHAQNADGSYRGIGEV